MEKPSSISRSEDAHTIGAVDLVPNVTGPMGADPDYVPRHGRSTKPWALLLAVFILIGVEIALRASGWPKKIPYALELDEYFAVAAAIEKYPMPDIVVVGSSRAREGLDIPVLRDQLNQLTGKRFTIANYAVSGGRAYVFEAITRRLLRESTPPKMIILGGAERDLGTDANMFDQAPLYWNWADWKTAWHQRGAKVLDDLPVVIRGYIGEVYQTLGYREQLALKARQMASQHVDEPTQLEGDLTVWQRENPKHSIARTPPADVATYARSVARPPFPNTRMTQSLNELAALCRERNVPLVMFQVPIPRTLEQNVPKGTETKFVETLKRVAAQHGAIFIAPGEMPVELTDRNFRDTSHLNLSGAIRVSEVLAKRLAPLLTTTPATSQASAKP